MGVVISIVVVAAVVIHQIIIDKKIKRFEQLLAKRQEIDYDKIALLLKEQTDYDKIALLLKEHTDNIDYDKIALLLKEQLDKTSFAEKVDKTMLHYVQLLHTENEQLYEAITSGKNGTMRRGSPVF
jgi:biopolymer transport protein ExbB/TolQ